MSILDPKDFSNQNLSDRKVKSNNLPRRYTLLILLFILTVIPIIAGVYFLIITQKKNLSVNNSQTTGSEIEILTKEISKSIILPDETPVLATVTDLEKVKGQIFFKNAQLGDKVLIYIQAKKAILYRPSGGLIVEIGTIDQKTKDIPVGQNSFNVTPFVTPTKFPDENMYIPITSPSPTSKVTPSATPSEKPVPTNVLY